MLLERIRPSRLTSARYSQPAIHVHNTAPFQGPSTRPRLPAGSIIRRLLSFSPSITSRHLLCSFAGESQIHLCKSYTLGAFSANGFRLYTTTRPRGQRNGTQRGGKKGKRYYTTEEDALIIDLRTRQRLGWKAIQESLPYRSANSLKCRWQIHLRPNMDIESSIPLLVRYSKAEAKRLFELRRNGLSWQKIQREHFPKRKIAGLQDLFYSVSRYSYVPSPQQHGRAAAYTPEEKDKLLYLKGVQNLSWPEIIKQMPGRTQNGLSTMYKRLQPTPGRSPNPQWSAAEDEILRRLRVRTFAYLQQKIT